MFNHPVSRELSAFCDNQLSPERAARVREHLRACSACRAELDQIAFGIRLAEKLPLVSAPESLWPSIEKNLSREVNPATWRRGWLRWRYAAAALVATLLITIGVIVFSQPRLRVMMASSPVSRLEQTAIEEHAARLQGGGAWAVQTADIAGIRSWLWSNGRLSASIPVQRPLEDQGRLQMVGAKLVQVEKATTAVIGYTMDSHPATLVTARLEDLQQPVREGRFSKDVVYRSDSTHGFRVLSWASDGQGYAMVSDLPGYGQEGCLLCHTTDERRRLIRNMTVER